MIYHLNLFSFVSSFYFILYLAEYKKTNFAKNVQKEYLLVFMALAINQVTYSDRKFCLSVGHGFASSGTFR